MFGVPLEYLMFGGIGFCLAWLTALMVLPAVHNRAVRLARARYDDLPLSMQEIRAEKDTIRAGFAAATCELELRIEKLREKTVAHTTDLAKKNQLIDRLKQEIDTVTAALRESESREQTARDALREAKRGFADKDVTLGTAEGEITVLKRQMAAKDTSLRAIEKELAAMRSAISDKESALHTAQDELSQTRRGFADKNASLGAVETNIAELQRELAARETALLAGERDLAAVRGELAGKDAALIRAEKEIAAIKAEISALTTLVIQTGNNQEREPGEIVAFVPAPRTLTHHQAVREPARPQPMQEPSAQQPARPQNEQTAPRAPIDVVAAPTQLIPPTIPQAAQQDNDSAHRAMTEITDAARRVDERHVGPNQRLRATYAPVIKNPT